MTASLLDEILGRLDSLSEEERGAVITEIASATKGKPFVPNPGPQTDAYYSKADVLLFGGNPGGGKTGLEIGLALNEHHRSLIVRRAFTDLEGLIDTAKKLVGSEVGFVGGMRPKYKKPDGGVIHFAGLSKDGGIGGHQGVAHDLICVDEAAQVPESQVRLLIGWLRTDIEGQRTRVVLGSNPPLDTTGDWLVPFFAPWLDETHPNPAEPGELRWFLTDNEGSDRECEEGDYIVNEDGVRIYAHSRSFIPSKYTDNPFYDAETYARTLNLLPSDIREILTTGNFMKARKDNPFQLIPTDWIRAAQQRWAPNPPQGVPMCAMGVDPAGGGSDDVAIATRYDGWYAPLIVEPGRDYPHGEGIAGLVITHRRDKARVILDMGGGYGSLPYSQLKENDIDVIPHKGAEASVRRSEDGQYKFTNKRTQVYWQFREALDPGQAGGSPIMLPPDDHELVSDLASLTYEVTSSGIKAEPKTKLIERLQRSPNRGDAVVMAWSEGGKMQSNWNEWKKDRPLGRKPQVVMKRKK